MFRYLVFATVLSVPGFAYGMGEFDSLQCDKGIASKGDTKYEVLHKCGEPARKEYVTRTYNYTGRQKTKSLEQWTYDFGPQQFLYLVNFDSSGTVANVYNTGNYGIKRPEAKTEPTVQKYATGHRVYR